MSSSQNLLEIERAAHKLVGVAMQADLPDFVAERLLQLKVLLSMVNDSDWGMSEGERNRILGAMTYFSDPIDLIPDHIPGIGFLDDAIYVEIIAREPKTEIDAYNEFRAFVAEEENRLKGEGLEPDTDQDGRISAKRDELHSRIREARVDEDDDTFVFHLL
ncbi:MAG: YkvA family protein [Gammaproteobacteria bacterium]|jgi:uncharacterized membrane protein YkvA (DUF1232 family)|nr:hypothetical protein [Gammaproteobacteria bacterium]MDP6096678.1 YkvA family protein [Gammaproteobacteria bacterium]MDP7455113.1 YkvA family protein [Gammaproteobacteria bacterium]HJO12051.1 YkvA family protein [Gammaproteobacteria bacterium]